MAGDENKPVLEIGTIAKLARGVRLKHDLTRDRHVLLAPERTIALDQTGIAIIEALDGARSIGEVAAFLAEKYTAPIDVISKDVVNFLTDLANRRMLEIST